VFLSAKKKLHIPILFCIFAPDLSLRNTICQEMEAWHSRLVLDHTYFEYCIIRIYTTIYSQWHDI